MNTPGGEARPGFGWSHVTPLVAGQRTPRHQEQVAQQADSVPYWGPCLAVCSELPGAQAGLVALGPVAPERPGPGAQAWWRPGGAAPRPVQADTGSVQAW